jgi:hypothetical protein
MDTESNIDKKYREQLFRYYFRNPILKESGKSVKWASPCPFCSPARKTESRRNEKVSALIWVDAWNTWTFTCRRDACPHRKLSFPRLIEELNPQLYKKYQQERYHAGTTGWQTNCPNPRDSVIPLPSKHQEKQAKSKNSRSQGTGFPRSNGNQRNPKSQGSQGNPTGADAPQDEDQQGI